MKDELNLEGQSLLSEDNLEGITGGKQQIGTKDCHKWERPLCPHFNNGTTSCDIDNAGNCDRGLIPLYV